MKHREKFDGSILLKNMSNMQIGVCFACRLCGVSQQRGDSSHRPRRLPSAMIVIREAASRNRAERATTTEIPALEKPDGICNHRYLQ